MQASNRDIYLGTIDHLVAGVMDGLNGTVFAYGATGSGKTYTMVGKLLPLFSWAKNISADTGRSIPHHILVSCGSESLLKKISL